MSRERRGRRLLKQLREGASAMSLSRLFHPGTVRGNIYITERTTQTLNFVRRNFSTCPFHIREHCYTTLVRPQLEYASSVWDNNIQCNVNKLESVQRRAARFVCHMTTDRHPASHPCYIDSLGTRRAHNSLNALPHTHYIVWSQ